MGGAGRGGVVQERQVQPPRERPPMNGLLAVWPIGMEIWRYGESEDSHTFYAKPLIIGSGVVTPLHRLFASRCWVTIDLNRPIKRWCSTLLRPMTLGLTGGRFRQRAACAPRSFRGPGSNWSIDRE